MEITVEEEIDITSIDSEIRERVARGAQFMDREYPGWTDLVDVMKLAMSDGRGCIIGQVLGLYSRNRHLVAIKIYPGMEQTFRSEVVRYTSDIWHSYDYEGSAITRVMVEYGFTSLNTEFDQLSDAWTWEIHQRT